MNQRLVRVLKIPVFLLCFWPLTKLLLEAFSLAGMSLGANPIEELLHRCGLWGLNFLLITLAVTPVSRLTGQIALIRFRRMFGLFAFFYVCLHFLIYAVLHQSFDLPFIVEDILERPYITLGIIALILLIPLAVTSTKGMMRRIGRKRTQLNKLVYLIAILGTWHFYWQVKKDLTEPLIYATILFLLLAYRVFAHWQKKKRAKQQKNSITVST
jgi:sulfoxide reductase heme-binding subunit YedZ